MQFSGPSIGKCERGERHKTNCQPCCCVPQRYHAYVQQYPQLFACWYMLADANLLPAWLQQQLWRITTVAHKQLSPTNSCSAHSSRSVTLGASGRLILPCNPAISWQVNQQHQQQQQNPNCTATLLPKQLLPATAIKAALQQPFTQETTT
jgi:hypothetical protein